MGSIRGSESKTRVCNALTSSSILLLEVLLWTKNCNNENDRAIVSKLLGRSDTTEKVGDSLDNDDVQPNDANEAIHRQTHFESRLEVPDWKAMAKLGMNVGYTSEESGETVSQDLGQRILSRLADYKAFIESSESYRWLVSKIWQHGRLSFRDRDMKSKIGVGLREKLQAYESLRKMSPRKPLAKFHVEFLLQWHPKSFVEDYGQEHPSPLTLDDILCITGSWCEAQAMTMANYMRQTWCTTGEAVIDLFRQLMISSKDEICFCESLQRSSI
jgi:hypothetical protein